MPVFDPKHFCQSWCECCEKNLALKPKHPKITPNMSVEEGHIVTNAILDIWHGVCGNTTTKYEECVKSVISSKEEANYVIMALKGCTCCKRHNFHKPDNIADKIWTTHVIPLPIQDDTNRTWLCRCYGLYENPKKYYTRCDCSCRHQARLIQQTFS